MGVKSGLKDVARALDIPFDEINAVSKKIDELKAFVPPQPDFIDYDKLKDSPVEKEKMAWNSWNELENKHKELFRLARNFEGLKRNFGIHASACLAMPCAVTNYFPTRVDKSGIKVTLYPGTMIEDLHGCKFDILGLKSIDVIVDTLGHIDKNLTINDLYQMADITDKNVYQMLCKKQSDCVFQLESDMFKGLLDKVQPHSINDVSAITSLGRPGPLSAGLPQIYADVKNEGYEPIRILRNIDNIIQPTNYCIVYQEQVMQISKQVSGFNANQADALMRKAIAKKKLDMFPMIRRCLIYGKKNIEGPDGWETNDNLPWYDPKQKYGDEIAGALVNGYTVEEMDLFWNDMLGYASYAFNASHAMTYSYISFLMAWLKYYYPVQFFTAMFSNESDEASRKKYIKVANEFAGITTVIPDINRSVSGFSCNVDDKIIYYGLQSIKGIGESKIATIIDNRPYTSLEDMVSRLPKKILNKTVAEALIKSGALDAFDTNRHALLNELHRIRKDRVDMMPEIFTEDDCIKMETETLGINLTYDIWWDTVKKGSKLREVPATVLSKSEILDKKGGLMAFLDLSCNGCKIRSIAFSRTYARHQVAFMHGGPVLVTGKKDDKDELIIDKVEIA